MMHREKEHGSATGENEWLRLSTFGQHFSPLQYDRLRMQKQHLKYICVKILYNVSIELGTEKIYCKWASGSFFWREEKTVGKKCVLREREENEVISYQSLKQLSKVGPHRRHPNMCYTVELVIHG